MTDSGKHSALRQTDDGSFELVLDRQGLQEVSEEEVSVAEVLAPEPPPARTSSRVLIFSAIGVVALLAIAAIGWWALSPGGNAEQSVDEVAGFKPYVGGEAADNAKKQADRRARIAAIADAQPPEEAEVVEQVAEEEITEDEAGWELSEQSEDGVIVEVEGTDELADVAEAEEEEDIDNVEPPPADVRSLMPQKRLDALRNANLGRSIQAPRVPGLGGSGIGARKLPIRNLQPVDEEDSEEAELEEGEGDEDIVDEDIVEEDEVVEEELQ